MTGIAETNVGKGFPWRIAGWGLAAGLLLLPAVAMRYTDEVNWTASDFVFAAVLLGGVGLGAEFLVRRSALPAYRLAAVLALLAAFFNVWVNGAVGMIGSEDNPYNLLFLAVIGIAAVGAIAARFRAAGMASAMLVAGTAHLLVAAFGMTTDLRGSVLSMVLGALWLGSAALFARAARHDPTPGA